MARIAIVPGDGVGPEVIAPCVAVLDCLARQGLPLSYECFDLSADAYLRSGDPFPRALRQSVLACDALLLGALGDARVPDFAHAEAVLLGLRVELDLFANIRPIVALGEISGRPVSKLDCVVFRENTEGAYSLRSEVHERGQPGEVVIGFDVNTRATVERLIDSAFRYAMARRRQRVCLVDKSNVQREAHGVWQRAFWQLAGCYPDIAAEHRYVDACAAELVTHPEHFDVLVTPNQFGDILSDLGAALVGGVALVPSANVHYGAQRFALFEPIHGSAPKLAGRNSANPSGALLSTALLLEHLGLEVAGAALAEAVRMAFRAGVRTPDAGGSASTADVGARVLEELEARVEARADLGPG